MNLNRKYLASTIYNLQKWLNHTQEPSCKIHILETGEELICSNNLVIEIAVKVIIVEREVIYLRKKWIVELAVNSETGEPIIFGLTWDVENYTIKTKQWREA